MRVFLENDLFFIRSSCIFPKILIKDKCKQLQKNKVFLFCYNLGLEALSSSTVAILAASLLGSSRINRCSKASARNPSNLVSWVSILRHFHARLYWVSIPSMISLILNPIIGINLSTKRKNLVNYPHTLMQH